MPILRLVLSYRLDNVQIILFFFAGVIASIAALWRAEARPYMHALQCMISIEGMISPFTIEPFLTRRTKKLGANSNSALIVHRLKASDLTIINPQTFLDQEIQTYIT